MIEIVVTDIINAFYVQSKKGNHETIKNRKYYGLSFCNSGEIHYNKEGNTTVSDRSVAVILPKGQSYTISRTKTGLFPVINFECINYDATDVKAFPVSDPEKLTGLFFALREHLKAGQKLEAMSVFYGMLSFLTKTKEKDSLGAAEYIYENISDPDLTNEKLAAHLKISQTYLNRKFKDLHGVTPKQFILHCRMEHAKMLLRDDTKSVSEIAEECGYSSIYSFSRAFRNHIGVSPLHYKEAGKGSAN